jgi:hypothetical protein
MKVLDYSPIPFDGGKLALQDRIKGIFKFGFEWISEMKSQEVLIANLNRVLDKRFTLLRNVPLPDGGVTIPLLLLGSHGVSMLYNSPLRGIYRAQGDTWEIMDSRMRNFKPTKPNLIRRTQLMAKAFETFLQGNGYELSVNGILVFTDPGIHVNSQRSDVRIILMDAIERFASGFVGADQIMTIEDVRAIRNTIEAALLPEEEPDSEPKIVPHQQVTQRVDDSISQALQPLQQRFKFSRRQWSLLAFFFIADVLILIGFVVIILITA